MASDDVIELGSSDEETEPAPKKKKPPLNAMVHIPNKLRGVTIKPSKSTTKFNPATLLKGSIGKSVTVTKVSKNNVNPFANQKKVFNGKPVKPQPLAKRVEIPIQRCVSAPICTPTINRTAINPLNKTGIRVANNSKGNPIVTTAVNPINVVRIMKSNILPIKLANNARQPTKNISSLPPGITVKRTTPPNSKPDVKRRKLTPRVMEISKMRAISTNEVVELDDDEPATSSASRQWYLSPEDQPLNEVAEVTNDLEAKKAESPTKENSPDKTQKTSEKAKMESPNASKQEQDNNKEPEKTNFVEITIEDSPIKPPIHKKGFKVGTELPITIEDSPAKSSVDNPDPSQSSDDEHVASSKDFNSRKKLEYPKTIKLVETVEIEFEPLSVDMETEDTNHPLDNNKNKSVDADQIDNPNETEKEKKEKSEETEPTEKLKDKDKSKDKEKQTNEDKVSRTDKRKEKSKRVVEVVEIVEIEESPVKSPEVETQTTPKKNKQTSKPASKPEYKLTQIETVVIDEKEKDEFHPIYQSFINLCFELENSDDMKKIVEKKIKAYYRQVPKEYTESETFTDMVSSKLMAMKAGPEKMYLYIKDVVDELNLQRKLAKALSAKPAKNEEQEKFLYGEESEFDSKRQIQIRKLEKTLKKLHRAIQKLEEQEVDFDDEEDSVYILTDRYKERMVRVHAKLCQLTNTKMPSEARVQIDARPGQPKGPAKRLEKWINKKVPIGTPLPFPDFHDVLRCVREANQEDKLCWNEADIMEEARDLFTRCGKKLQRRRQENEWRLAASRLPTDEVDPAENSTDLKKRLEENKRVAAKKETEVFNKYADRQNQLKLEAVEIGDKEAEESPDESDDEETGDDSALTSRKKRKERLKRLLQEKSKKTSSNKENLPKDDQTVDGDNSKSKDIGPKDSSSIKYTDDQNKGTVDNTSQNEDPVENLKEAESSSKNLDDKGDIENKRKSSPERQVMDKSPSKDIDNDKATDSCSNNKDDDNKLSDKVHSLSDDSNKVESDIDELHLLQKLYSENELNTSIMDSTDTGSHIAISDTTSTNDTSGDEKHTKKSDDVISIENSSYSESEEKKGEFSENLETDNIPHKEAMDEILDTNMEIECSSNGVDKKTKKTNNEEYNKPLEDILLASSDEADGAEAPINTPVIETCINLKDDNISIGETVIEESQELDNDSEKNDKNTNTDASSVEGIEIGPTENCLQVNMVETTSVKSTDEGSITEITSIQSTDINDEGNSVEITSIKSVETIEDISDSGVKSVESVVEEVSEKSDENVEDEKVSETACGGSVETIEDESNSDTQAAKSIATLEDGSKDEQHSDKSVSLDFETSNEMTAIRSIESHDNVIKSVKSAKTIEDGNSIETEDDNSTSTGSETNKIVDIIRTVTKFIEDKNKGLQRGVKSADALDDKNTETNVIPVASCEEVNANETKNVRSVEALENITETVCDVTITDNGHSIKNGLEAMDTSDNIETCDAAKAAEIKEVSIPVSMDMDNVKET